MILDDTDAALYSKLASGTALVALLASGTASIYGDAPPDGAPYDYVLYVHSGGGAENLNASALENNVWLVQSFTTATAKRAAQIAGAVDALLHKQTLTIGSRSNFWTARETNVKLNEVDPAGTRIYRAGGYYRIRTTNI